MAFLSQCTLIVVDRGVPFGREGKGEREERGNVRRREGRGEREGEGKGERGGKESYPTVGATAIHNFHPIL